MAVKLKVVGYSVFLVKCADGSYYSGMCSDLNKKVKEINYRLEPYFMSRPTLVPVTLAFHEDHIPFKEAFVKHKYLRALTKKQRDRIIRLKKWPLGKELRKFIENY